MSTDQWRPAQYHRFRAERSQPFYDLFALVERTDLPRRGPRVVDLGCGTGELTSEAHRMLAARETTGIDRSAAMLADAAAWSSPRLTFVPGDIADFPDGDGCSRFDVILSNAALQWVPDHAAVLTRWCEALTEHGQLAVQVPANVEHPAHLAADEVAREAQFAEAFASGPAGAPPPDPVHSVLPPDGYATLLDQLGFGRQHVRLQVYGHHLASTTEVVEWVRGTSLTRFQAALPPAVFDAFVARYTEVLVERLGDRRPYFYAFKRILLWGRR